MRALLAPLQQQLQKAGYPIGVEKPQKKRQVRPCLVPLALTTVHDDIVASDGTRLPDKCAAIVWRCLVLPEQASASAASSGSRRAAPALLRLIAAVQRFCGAAESGAATRDLRAMTELAAEERVVLHAQLQAVLELNVDLVRCHGAPMLTRITAVRNLGRALRDPQRLTEFFATFDCSTDTPAQVLPALEALLWAASSDHDKMRQQSMVALVHIVRTIATGIREASTLSTAAPSKSSQWSVAWEARQAQEVELRVDIAAFHRSPEAWLSARTERGDSLSQVAQFLSSHRRAIDAAKLGEFLGRRENVLSEFIQQVELKGVPIVPAFTRVLSGLQMPGEAQQVDRICEQFGNLWGAANGVDSSNAYIFTFSIVMLSTDLHRPAEKGHVPMTFAQFHKNTSGALAKPGLPDKVYKQAYRQLRNGALFVRDDAELGPAQLCTRLRRALCCQSGLNAASRQQRVEAADLPGVWQTVWSAAWRPLLGAFTLGAAPQGGEKDEESLEAALRGLQLGSQAAALLDEAVQAEAFSTALMQLSIPT